MASIKEDIKNNEFGKLYFFFGDEEYLNDYYSEAIIKALVNESMKLFNYLSFNMEADVDACENFLNSPPMMNPKKVLYLKECNLCQKSTSEAVRERFKDILSNLPDYVTVIINEKNPVKTMSVYKVAQKSGLVTEHKFQSERDLQSWVIRYVSRDGYEISPQDALYLVSNSDNGMYSLKNELEKLMSYKADNKKIEKADIDICVVKSIEGKVFEMLESMMNSDMDNTMKNLSDLKTLKEPAVRVLTIIANEYTRIKKAKLLNGKMSKNDIAKEIGMNPYFVDKIIKYANKFSDKYINTMLKECQKTDYYIKSGRIEQWSALEDIILKAHIMKKSI